MQDYIWPISLLRYKMYSSLLASSLIEDFLDEYDVVNTPGVSSILSLGKAKPLDSKIVFEYNGGKLNTR